MVYVDPRNLSASSYFEKWVREKLPINEGTAAAVAATTETLEYLYSKYVDPSLAFLKGKGSSWLSRRSSLLSSAAAELLTGPPPVAALPLTEVNLIEKNFALSQDVHDFTDIVVPTAETARYSALLQRLAGASVPVLFIGHPGTAKSLLLQHWLRSLDPQQQLYAQVNLSSRTSSLELQRTLEDNIDKRTGRIFGPPAGKLLKIFIDDLNMPKQIAQKLPKATTQLYHGVVNRLTRTPLKFHYIFNLRDLSRVYQGIWQVNEKSLPNPNAVVRIWRHECLRVFQDRLINKEDGKYVDDMLYQTIQEHFPEEAEAALQNPLLWTDCRSALSIIQLSEHPASEQRTYEELSDFGVLRATLLELIDNYRNQENAPMNVVMFEDAISHVLRILRLLRLDRGHALLLGTGGSGKRQLTVLAAYIAGYAFFQLSPTRNYGEGEFKEELRTLFALAAAKPVCFLFADTHVVEEVFLESINHLLTVGGVPALFNEDQKEALLVQLRRSGSSSAAGFPSSSKQEARENNAWTQALACAKANIHIAVAMSPAGDTLRNRCRNFPGLISCTSIDWFHPWPEEALREVARHYLCNDTNDRSINGDRSSIDPSGASGDGSDSEEEDHVETDEVEEDESEEQAAEEDVEGKGTFSEKAARAPAEDEEQAKEEHQDEADKEAAEGDRQTESGGGEEEEPTEAATGAEAVVEAGSDEEVLEGKRRRAKRRRETEKKQLSVKIQEQVELLVVSIHLSAATKYAPEFEKTTGRRNFITSKNYVDFLQCYGATLRGKREEFNALTARLKGGLQKMKHV
ncbi:UNVERIFIED_CONTAM: hypothetical protein H355_014890 [Colinus virginianus]|nr:hypothetical protein H355_014890 [Colinus virginianus]